MAESAPPPSDECWVVKLGGSLLNLPGLSERLRAVVRSVSTKPLLVIGGGAAADLVREWDRVHLLDSASAHWLAVRAMDFNGQLIENLLPEAVGVSSFEQAETTWGESRVPILKTWEWLHDDGRKPNSRQHSCSLQSKDYSLPYSWEVTSDSIAAWAAIRWRAEGLMLLKSVDAPGSNANRKEIGEDAVDEYFHHLAPRLPQIAWCNLRSQDLKISTLPGNHFETGS